MSTAMQAHTTELDRVVIRFAGDSGDGIQLTGERNSRPSAPSSGTTRPPFPTSPARCGLRRGPSGVSAFQVHISDHDILTPGDEPNVSSP